MMLFIRNMESERCKTTVMNELNKLGLSCKKVELGAVELKENLSEDILQLIDNTLKNAGLELMFDKKTLLIEKIKTAIHQWIHLSDDLPKKKLPDYLRNIIKHDYNYLSNLFSGVNGFTIEKYVISQKIEYVKELLVYDKLSLTDIAFKLQYSSVAHLSNQFKKVTGLTPTFFKQHRNANQCIK
jgi:YesN/AraC family two-component response regulator